MNQFRREARCILRASTAGFSLLEVAITTAILGAVLLATATAFGSTMNATDQARRTTEAAIFLEATVENISAQPYDNLLSLDGNTVFDGTNAADSNFSVSITATQAEVDLIQVTASLNDLALGRQIGRLNTLRSDR